MINNVVNIDYSKLLILYSTNNSYKKGSIQWFGSKIF